MDRLDELLSSYEQEMITTLQELVRIPSVDGVAQEGKPFGEACYDALQYALAKAAAFGFETHNDDGYAGHAQMGQGDKTLGILAHLDVVPEGEDWTMPPYAAILKEDYLYGRGVSDNKNSCVSVLFAMRAIKEAGIPLSQKVRLILGCNEEKGSADMKHYAKTVGMPDYGFSPDAGFPVCYAEKGIHRIELSSHFSAPTPLLALTAGNAVNIVPNRCTAQVVCDENAATRFAARAQELSIPLHTSWEKGVCTLTCEGIARHAAFPYGSRNAIALMTEILSALPMGGAQRALDLIRESLNINDFEGQKLNIDFSDEPSGKLTVNLGLIRIDAQGMTATLDIRQPVTITFETVQQALALSCAPYNVTARTVDTSNPLYLPLDNPLVVTLMDVFQKITGLDTPPFSMGGGTYARSMPNAVAFGPSLPGAKSGGEHGPDEHLYLPELFTAARIYAHTIVALAAK